MRKRKVGLNGESLNFLLDGFMWSYKTLSYNCKALQGFVIHCTLLV